ncbi:MAG: GNAT family protein [Actinomycetota bacterium]|nr:GNAT family protein [Actinomycetota bacterium]
MTEQSTDDGIEAVGSRPPILATARPSVRLAPWAIEHRAGLLRIADDERIARNMTEMFPHPYTPVEADRWLAVCANDDLPLHFAVLSDGEVAGGVGGTLKDDILAGTAELGWWLGHRFWGDGVATVAVRRLIRYCFEDLALDRVEAGVMLRNPASARVAEKAGFELEGVAKLAYLKNGERIDRLLFGLVKTDWSANTNR